jgi:hypothetical protein
MGTMEVVFHCFTLEKQFSFTIAYQFIEHVGISVAKKCHTFRDEIKGALDLNET